MGKGERERERLRQERIEAEERESRSGSNRTIVAYAIASTAVLAIAVLAFVLVSGGDDSSGNGNTDDGGAHINGDENYGNTNGLSPDERAGIIPAPVKVTDLKTAADEAGCELRLKLPDEGNTHLPKGAQPPTYKTSPPSSGNHVEPPYQQADGAYSEEPDQLNVVHSLEHGRMAIEYSPDLPEKAQLELKGLYDTMYGAALMFPYEMAYDVAAVTWTNTLTCREFKGQPTLDAIRAFGKETWGKYGGEPVFAFKFTGPTPAEPDEPSS